LIVRPAFRTAAWVGLCLVGVARAAGAQPCHPMTPALRAEIARVEQFLDSGPGPVAVRVSDVVSDRRVVQVGGLDVHIMGLSTDARVRRLRAGVRRVAERIDRALSELGPSAGSLPVYLVPFDAESYDLPTGGTTLAETRCYNQVEPLYVDDRGAPLVPGRSCVIVVFLDAIESEPELDFALAHEWFHTLQHGSFPDADHTCRSAWWREGAADWFAHLMVEGTDVRDGAIEAFFASSGRQSLTAFSYEAQVFHFWAAARFGKPWVFELGRRTDRQLGSPGAVSDIMSADDWRAWAEALADGRVTYPDGRPLPGELQVSIRPVAGNGTLAVNGPPLSVQFVAPSFTVPGGYDVDVTPRGGLLATRQDAATPGEWRRIAAGGERLRLDAECSRPSAFLVAIGLGAQPLGATVRYTGSGGAPCDACYLGQWREVLDRHPGDVSIVDPGRGRIAGIDYSRLGPNAILARLPEGRMRREWADWPLLTIGADGRYTLDDPRVSTMIAPDGQEYLISQDTTYRESGSWAPVDGGQIEVRRQRREVDGTQVVMGQGRPYREERQLRGLPVRYVPFCSAERLELWLPPMLQLKALQERDPTAGDGPARPARVFRRH
jgi:hypothetical protein